MSDEDKNVLEQDANAQVESEITEKTQEDDSAEEKESSEDVKKEEERPAWTMPVSKALEEKNRAVEKAKEEAQKEAETEMQKIRDEYEKKLQESRPKEDYEKELESVAEEHGLDKNAAKKLLDVFKKSIRLPDTSKVDAFIREQEIAKHKTAVSNEFDEKVVSLIKQDYPSATNEFIQEVKGKVSELAFTKGYTTYRIEDIYKSKKDEFVFKNGRSAEPSGGRTSDSVDFDRMTDDEEHELAENDPKKYKEYLKFMSSKNSRYLD